MRITPPADDYGRQRLRIQNRASGDVHQAPRVEPYPRIAPSEERRERRPVLTIRRRLHDQPRPPLTDGEWRRRQHAQAYLELEPEEDEHRIDVRV